MYVYSAVDLEHFLPSPATWFPVFHGSSAATRERKQAATRAIAFRFATFRARPSRRYLSSNSGATSLRATDLGQAIRTDQPSSK